MTDPLSLRAMAEQHHARLKEHMAWLRKLPAAAIGQQTADAIEALLAAQSSWANEKAEMERQLAAYRDPDWTKNPRTARSDKNMEDGWALGEAKEAAEAALAEADRLGADYMDEDYVLPPEEAIRIGSDCLQRHKERLASLPLAAKP